MTLAPSPSPLRSSISRSPGRCGVCGTWADPGTARSCPRCEVRTHRDCWDFVACCPTYGCLPPRPARPAAGPARPVVPVSRGPEPAGSGEPRPGGRLVAALVPWARFAAMLFLVLGTACRVGALQESGAVAQAVVIVAAVFAAGFASRAAVKSVSRRETSAPGSEWCRRALVEFVLVAGGAVICVPLSVCGVAAAMAVGLVEPLVLAYSCVWLWSFAYSAAWAS